MRIGLLFFFILQYFLVDAQVLLVEFKDDKTNEPIPNVSCQAEYFVDEIKIVKTNISSPKGILLFQFTGIETNPGLLIYEHPIYVSGQRRIILNAATDTTVLRIFLKAQRVQEVKEVILKPNRPDTIFASKTYSVGDFELGEQGQLYLLTYEKNLQHDAQLQCRLQDSTVFMAQIPQRANGLLRDFRGNIHVQTDNTMYGVRQIDGTLQLGAIPKDYYYKYIAPVVDTSLTRQFYSSYMEIYPAFEYGCLDLLDSTYKSILHIQDDLMMELYRSEYKWVDVRTKLWAKNLEHQTGIDAEIYVGANVFTQSIYYEPVYAPLFLVHDTLFIFDYPKDLLRVYNLHGDLLKSIPLYHHYRAKQSGFQKNLQQDRKTGLIYALFEQDGYSYVGRINLANGTIEHKVRLAFRYVEKVRIYNDAIYFIYRPFESTQKKFLYKQKLTSLAN
jgi:hypothetical protein